MSKPELCVAIAAACTLLAGPPAASAAATPETVSGAWTPQWFVELEGAPTADGTAAPVLESEHVNFKAEARAAGIHYRERFAYDTLFNGVSVSATDAGAAEIRNLDGVAAVYPVQTLSLGDPEPTGAFQPDLAFALTMTGADIAQSQLGYTGRGIHVAIVDSGVDYDHPDLGGCFGPACRVTNGYDFVGDDYDDEARDATWQPIPHPDPYPDDCYGHGTHVAGIVGANGGVRGVAPDVTIGSYRVIGCHGGASDDVLLAALERVYSDGADVVNMSLGDALNAWPQSPTAKAAARLVRKGIVVVAAAGNNFTDGLFAAGAPAVGDGVIDAASVDNLVQYALALKISPDDHAVRIMPGNGSAPIPASGTATFAATGTPASLDDACNPLPPGSLDGKVALVRRGTCTFLVKATNVVAAGATGMIGYSSDDTFLGTPLVPGIGVPVAYISRADGELIDARLKTGPVTLRWGAIASLPSSSAGRISGFSSMGLAADLSLKPEIAAPGGSILSTVPLELGRYEVASGTSMASPHVAGAAALYLQAHPHAAPPVVAAALENSADPVAAPSGALEPVVRQGSGLVDIDDAIQATTRITPGTLSLGDDAARTRQSLTIENRGRTTVTYALSAAAAPAIAGRDILFAQLQPNPSAVTFTLARRPVSSLTLPARGVARVDIDIAPDPALSEGAVYGGYLVFTPTDDNDPPLRVPYAGYKGDYQTVPVLTPTTQGFPWLARQTGVSTTGLVLPLYTKQDARAVFTMAPVTFGSRTGADIPIVLLHLNNFARRIRVEVFRPGRRQSLGVALTQDYVPRNQVENLLSSAGGLTTALPFDGTVRRGRQHVRLAEGDYQLVVSAEGPLSGRNDLPETWTSPVFRISRGARSR
jgi:minor extracellular serine protease Vpr